MVSPSITRTFPLIASAPAGTAKAHANITDAIRHNVGKLGRKEDGFASFDLLVKHISLVSFRGGFLGRLPDIHAPPRKFDLLIYI